jgi:hypothetical protein
MAIRENIKLSRKCIRKAIDKCDTALFSSFFNKCEIHVKCYLICYLVNNSIDKGFFLGCFRQVKNRICSLSTLFSLIFHRNTKGKNAKRLSHFDLTNHHTNSKAVKIAEIFQSLVKKVFVEYTKKTAVFYTIRP